LIRKCGVAQLPGAGDVERSDEVAHGSLEVHAVAAETIVHQDSAAVVVGIEEYALIGSAVRAGLPIGEFRLVAFLAATDHFEYVGGAEFRRFGSLAAEMDEYATHVVDMESGVESENVAMACAAFYIAVRRAVPIGIGLPDFMAGGASATAGTFVVKRNC
jgi:hypothetical protein